MQLGSFVRVRVRQLSDIAKPTHQKMDRGLLVVNPPWGERLSTPSAAANLYAALGQVMHSEFVDGMRQSLPLMLHTRVPRVCEVTKITR